MSAKSSDLSEKLAISLPRSVVREMERLRKSTGETRSSFIQRAIRMILEERDRKARLQRYVEGYLARPETPEEVKAAEASATYLLAEEPWE